MNDGSTIEGHTQTTLGRYTILRRIGSGGMGDVWLAEDPVLRRQVAIKTLPTHSQGDDEYLQRFVREARAAATLNHPHILLVHDYGEQPLPNGQFITYIVMPFVTGGTLSDRIEMYASRRMLVPLAESLSYLSQAAEAIDYAHAQGIIHRDIKPKNMLLRADQWLLLTDFGIARILADQQQLTQTGVSFGTPDYMAPEQAQGKAVAASDIYSLAVIAYQLFTGRLPFTADTGYAITIQHITMPPPPPRQFNPALSPAAEQVILQGLAKDPAHRPASAQAFVAALRAAQANMPSLAPTSPEFAPTIVPGSPTGMTPSTGTFVPTETGGFATRGAKGISRRGLLIGGGTALVLLGGGLGAWALASHPGKSAPDQGQRPSIHNGATSTPTIGPNGPALILTGHTQPVNALAWSPKAPILISGGVDSRLMLWDIQGIQQGKYTSAKPKVDLPDAGSDNVLLAWSPDGTILAVGNAVEPTTDLNKAYVVLYRNDLSGKVPGFANPIAFPNTSSLTAMTWAPGKYLTTAIVINELDKQTNQIQSLSQFALTASSLGSRIATAAPVPVQVVTPVAPDVKTTLESRALAYSPDGSMLAAATTSGVALVNLSLTGTTLRARLISTLSLSDEVQEADVVTWSPDGRHLAALNIGFGGSSTLDVWNMASGNKTPAALTLPGDSTTLQTLAWCPAPGSTLLAGGSATGPIYLWDASKNGSPVRRLNGLSTSVQALAWSYDGKWLAAAYKDNQNSILLWNM